jgi:hypothetical protein
MAYLNRTGRNCRRFNDITASGLVLAVAEGKTAVSNHRVSIDTDQSSGLTHAFSLGQMFEQNGHFLLG